MAWLPRPARFSPSDLGPGRVYQGRGFAMPLSQALAEGARAASEAEPAGPVAPGLSRSAASVVVGGSGFLGRRLVERLLRDGGDVVVVSRNPGPPGGAPVDAVSEGSPGGKLTTLAADVSDPSCLAGLTRALRGAGVGTVFHLAARVHAFGGWEAMRGPNVEGTLVASRLAGALGCGFQLASTLSVFVSSNNGGEGTEGYLSPDPATLLYGGYAQTKAASEAVATTHLGLGAAILRYGLLVPEDGRDLADDHFLRGFVRGLMEVGCIPDEAEESWVDLTPVGQAAEASVAIARSGSAGVFHYANPVPATLSDLVLAVQDALAGSGRPRLGVVDAGTWRAKVRDVGGLRGAIVEAAFDKAGFLAGAARRGPFLNADLFQSTGRRYGIDASLAAGAPVPTHPSLQADRLVRPLVLRG